MTTGGGRRSTFRKREISYNLDVKDGMYWPTNTYHLHEYGRVLHFWQSLTNTGVKRLVEVTDDIPLDRHGGLMNLDTVCWTRMKLLFCLVTIGRMFLNWVTIWRVAHLSIANLLSPDVTTLVLRNSTGSLLELHPSKLSVCEADIIGPHHCFEAKMSRLLVFQIITITEGVTVTCMLLAVLFFTVGYLCTANHGSWPADRPYVFFFLPKLVAKSSSISFLQLLNYGRFKSLFLRREVKLWAYMLRWSCCIGKENKFWKDAAQSPHNAKMREFSCVSDESGEESTEEDWAEDLFNESEEKGPSWYAGVVVYVFLVLFSCLAMLTKLTPMSFAALTGMSTWTWREWLAVAGFMNQLAGLSWLDEVEMHRVLLFKFGGPKAQWTMGSVYKCDCYFRFVAMAISGGKIGKGAVDIKHRLKVMSVLYTMTADDIQRLLTSRQREDHLIDEQQDRLDHIREMFVGEGAREFHEAIDEYARAKKKLQKEMKPAEAKIEAAKDLECGPAWRGRLEQMQQKQDAYIHKWDPPQLRMAKLAQEHVLYLKHTMEIAKAGGIRFDDHGEVITEENEGDIIDDHRPLLTP